MAKRIEKWLDARGELHDTEDEAKRGDTQALIADDLKRLYNENGDVILHKDAQRDLLAWHGVELLAILKRHLEPPKRKPNAPLPSEVQMDLAKELAGQGGWDYEIAREIAREAPELFQVLGAYLEFEKAEVGEAPIDEAKAERALFDVLLGEGVYAMAEEDATITQVLKHRREVVMILQGIERPEPISEDEAQSKVLSLLGGNATSRDIVTCRKSLLAILERVR